MQKFGLQRNSSANLNAIELELVKEQATALGRAGRKLRLSLEHYQSIYEQIDKATQTTKHKQPTKQERDSIVEIANNVWELILQREFVGFTENNLHWVRDKYYIPEAALKRLGLNTE